MKKAFLLIAMGSLVAFSAQAGDWGKAPVYDKAPIEECIDLGGNIGFSYHTDYIYKGARLGRDTIGAHLDYTFANLAVPITIGLDYYNVINGIAPNLDDLSLYASAGLGTVAGFDLAVSYTQHFYPEINFGAVNVLSSHGEIGLHASRDLGFMTVKADMIYNLNVPNAGNLRGGGLNNDSGAWYYDFGLEKAVAVGPANLILNAGVAYADNYFGRLPNAQTGGRSSGWNHYYIRASLPIEFNCRTTVTPYIGYNGAPDSFLMDGLPGGGQSFPGGFNQSDIFHGGISLNVEF